jgi:hypothetical protein
MIGLSGAVRARTAGPAETEAITHVRSTAAVGRTRGTAAGSASYGPGSRHPMAAAREEG